jgi:GNAT superfamily N-acetyltransferase
MTIETFTADHVGPAAELLAARQRALRATRPELPAAFEVPDAYRAALEAMLAEPGSHGVMAIHDGRPGAFMLGYHRAQEIWARAAWSPIDGSASDPALGAVGGELLRDCFAAWSADFVRRGIFRQYVHAAVDTVDEAAWFNTGFGRMQAHAVRDLAPPRGTEPEGVEIRIATPDDLDGMEALIHLIQKQLVLSPAWAISLPEGMATARSDWADELANPEGELLLALEGGRILGAAGYYLASPGPMVPDGAWELGVAMTLPEARGRGIQGALLRHGVAAAAAAGATHMVTDWRTASLATARSWTALGFRPIHHRLHRHIDERVAWAAASVAAF